MIKKTLCFSNPAYLSLRDAQLVIKLPEVEKADNLTEAFKKANEVTRPIEDIGVVVLDHKQITVTQGALEALLENNSAVITCDASHMPEGLLLPLVGNTTQNERIQSYVVDGVVRLTNRDEEGHQGVHEVPQASHSGRLHHVPVLHLCAPLCQHGEC